MELFELQRCIKDKCLPHVLYFTGEEVGIMNVYINKITEKMLFTTIRSDSVQECYLKMQQKKMSSTPRLFIVSQDKEFLKAEKLWDKIKSVRSNDYLIIIYYTLDKRGKFYKSEKENFTEFARLSPQTLVKYIQNDLDLTDKDALALAEICEGDYSRILLEIDKVKHYKNAAYPDKPYHTEALRELIAKQVIYRPVGDITFKFTDAIVTRNMKGVAEYLLQAKQKQESAILVLSVLYETFRQIFMVQCLGPDHKDAVKRTGLTAWQVKNAQDKSGHYWADEIIEAMRIIQNVESGIKKGEIEENIAIDYVLAKIL